MPLKFNLVKYFEHLKHSLPRGVFSDKKCFETAIHISLFCTMVTSVWTKLIGHWVADEILNLRSFGVVDEL